MCQLERAGKASVMIVSHGFEAQTAAAAKVYGVPELRYVVAPLNYKSLTPEQAIAQTDPLVGDIIRLLTSPVGHPQVVRKISIGREKEQFQGIDRFEAYEKFNEAFLQNDWGDGYPLLPPTEERVSELLRGTTRRPEDVVCILPPENGLATVEKIAVNAAMAGCRPEHLPVVMAGLQAIVKVTPVLRLSFLTSTSAHAPLFLLNGPIAEELGVNGARCCLGPGRQNAVNIKIGRALMLAIKNIGHLYPGIQDMDTIGSPRKFNFCLAENEKESPWDPFHVEQGYPREASTISVFATLGDRNVAFQGHLSAEHLLRQIAIHVDGANASSQGYFLDLRGDLKRSEGGRLLLLPPIYAQALTDGGFSKKATRDFLFQVVTQSARRLLEPCRKLEEKIFPQWRWLARLPEWEAEKILLPVVEYPELFHLVVAGSDRPKPLICPLYALPTTVEITDRA